MNLNFLRRPKPPATQEQKTMAIPNAEMMAKKQEWDDVFGPTFVDLNTVGDDFGYVAGGVSFPFNRWMLSYGFAEGPFAGVPQKKVSIWQSAKNPAQFVNNQSVDDHRYDSLSLTL